MPIIITYKTGKKFIYEPECYTDYEYNGKAFIVIYGNRWIGIHNMDNVERITIGYEDIKEDKIVYS